MLLWTVWIGLCCGVLPAAAGNRALIVTIGLAYQQKGLPAIAGPEKDAELARSLARYMGFQDSDTRLIQESQATRSAILDGLTWVRDGIQGGGKALIYYSGHGAQVDDKDGDEPDGCDEALVPVDGTSPDQYILDDEIGRILDSMDRTSMIVMVVDSCFSGTITRSIYGGDTRDIKLADNSVDCNRPINIKSTLRRSQMEVSGANRVILTATAENEVAYGDLSRTGKGSALSQAIADVVRDGGSSPLTFQSLRDKTAQNIKTQCDARSRTPHHPTLDGDPGMFTKDIRLTGASASNESGVTGARNPRELLDRIVNSSQFAVVLKPDKTALRVGDEIRFDVISTRGGYLNIVELRPDGELNVIFPNAMSGNNKISADVKTNVPGDVMGGKGFRFTASKPLGKSLMVALVTQEPVNLFTEQRMGSTTGNFKSLTSNDFGILKSTLTRSLAVEAVPDTNASGREYGAVSIQIDTVRK
jgi:hypothetical protein